MALVIDPAGNELRALRKVTRWRGKHILEVGCGDGRLSQRLAALGVSRIDALDPDPALIRLARKQLPPQLSPRIQFHVGQAERLKHPDNTFDGVLFAWVL